MMKEFLTGLAAFIAALAFYFSIILIIAIFVNKGGFPFWTLPVTLVVVLVSFLVAIRRENGWGWVGFWLFPFSF